MEKQLETGGELDKYEIEGPDRAELLQDLGEFQLASVRLQPVKGSWLPSLRSLLVVSRQLTGGVGEILAV